MTQSLFKSKIALPYQDIVQSFDTIGKDNVINQVALAKDLITKIKSGDLSDPEAAKWASYLTYLIHYYNTGLIYLREALSVVVPNAEEIELHDSVTIPKWIGDVAYHGSVRTELEGN